LDNMFEKINEASDFIIKKIKIKPEIGIILGSGLGDMADEINDYVDFDFNDVPHFPVSTVEGHKGKIYTGILEGKNVIALKGRVHYYEGYSMKQVTFPVRVMKALGVKSVILTNACGGINNDFNVGDIMILNDHINLTGDNPLKGFNDSRLGPRFPDMSSCYDPEYIKLANEAAKRAGIEVKTGVYAGLSGPAYETMAEIKYLRIIGADAVGMSTVPEAIVAVHTGIRTLGLSCITDVIFKKHDHSVSHDDVIKTANLVKPKFIKFIREILKSI